MTVTKIKVKREILGLKMRTYYFKVLLLLVFSWRNSWQNVLSKWFTSPFEIKYSTWHRRYVQATNPLIFLKKKWEELGDINNYFLNSQFRASESKKFSMQKLFPLNLLCFLSYLHPGFLLEITLSWWCFIAISSFLFPGR